MPDLILSRLFRPEHVLAIADRTLDRGWEVLHSADFQAGVKNLEEGRLKGEANTREKVIEPTLYEILGRLQLGDDFHRPNLRCPGDRAARKCRTQEIDRAESFAQPAADFRDQVMHELVRLDPADGRHAHGAISANAAQVVAEQIDDQDVLGAV